MIIIQLREFLQSETLEFSFIFSFHINTLIEKKNVFKMLKCINRNMTNFKNTNALKILYFFLVRSDLEFESIV